MVPSHHKRYRAYPPSPPNSSSIFCWQHHLPKSHRFWLAMKISRTERYRQMSWGCRPSRASACSPLILLSPRISGQRWAVGGLRDVVVVKLPPSSSSSVLGPVIEGDWRGFGGTGLLLLFLNFGGQSKVYLSGLLHVWFLKQKWFMW